MNYLVTGVTGVVGSHILFELLNNKFSKFHHIDIIYVVIRKKEQLSAKDRLLQILNHIDTPDYIKTFDYDQIINSIQILEFDLLDKINLPNTELTVIHSAGSTNLSQDINASIEVEENNFRATQNLIESIQNKKSKFIYISTAFSEGYINNKNIREFRNPYEKAKYETEKNVIKLSEKNVIDWKILRPSIVCGRLLDPPLYFTPKFDVFYGWAKFFHTFKNHITTQFRICANQQSSLNIIPVDILAKKIVFYATNSKTKIKNLISNTSIPIEIQIKSVMENLNITNFSIVDSLPEKLSKAEEIYYNSIGKIFTPYIINPIYFKAEQYDLNIKYDVKDKMNDLIKYAITKNFKESY